MVRNQPIFRKPSARQTLLRLAEIAEPRHGLLAPTTARSIFCTLLRIKREKHRKRQKEKSNCATMRKSVSRKRRKRQPKVSKWQNFLQTCSTESDHRLR